MQELLKYFHSVSPSIKEQAMQNSQSVLAHRVSCVNDACVDGNELVFSDYSFAIIGLVKEVDELAGAREDLYQLYHQRTGKEGKIIDFGDLMLDKQDALAQIVNKLLDHNIFTVVLSPYTEVPVPDQGDDLLNLVMKRFERSQVSSILPAINNQVSYLARFEELRSTLFNVNLLCYQQYLSDPEFIERFKSYCFEDKRLGEIRKNIHQAEPLLRDIHLLFADVRAVRQCDAPIDGHHNPNGLFADEFCQLLYYAGLSDNLQVVKILACNNIAKNKQMSTFVAQAIWHLYSGSQNKYNESLLKNVNGVKKIIVELGVSQQQIVFYFSELTNRWWMQIATDISDKVYIYACTEDDYKNACANDIPLKWLWYHQKLVKGNESLFKTY